MRAAPVSEGWGGAVPTDFTEAPRAGEREARVLQASAGGLAAPTEIVAAMFDEYASMPQRQRLAVVAALTTSFIVVIGVGLLWLERRAMTPAFPTRPRRAPTRAAPSRPAHAVISDLARAIRQHAENSAAMSGSPPRAGSSQARNLDEYFAEIEALSQGRGAPAAWAGCAGTLVREPRSASNGSGHVAAKAHEGQTSLAADPADRLRVKAPPSPVSLEASDERDDGEETVPAPTSGRFGLRGYASSRRRAWAQRRAAAKAANDVPTQAQALAPAAPRAAADIKESKLYVVREIGRIESEARRLRESGVASKPPASRV